MEDTVDKFGLRPHIHGSVECLGARWMADMNHWAANFKDWKTGLEFTRSATILISAVGGISIPRDVGVSKSLF